MVPVSMYHTCTILVVKTLSKIQHGYYLKFTEGGGGWCNEGVP